MKKYNIILIISISVLFFTKCDIIDVFDNDPPTSTHKVGDTIWVHQIPELDKSTYLTSIPFAIGSSGDIYYIASGGTVSWESARIYAINKEDGTLKWKTAPLATWHINSNIVVGDDGTIYILSGTKLFSVNPNNGDFNWQWEVPEHLVIDGIEWYSYGETGALSLCNNGDLVFKTTGSGSYVRAMYCVNKDGNTKWWRYIQASGIPISIGNTGIIFDYESFKGIEYLDAIDPNNGTTLWQKRLDYAGSAAANIVITTNGDLICDIGLDSMYSISPSGKINWKIKSGTYQKNKVLGSNGIIYGYNQFNGMHRFDVQTGSEIEIIKIPDNLVIDKEGNFYHAGGDAVYVYDEEGNQKDAFPFHVYTHSLNLTLSKDNIIYSGGPDKKIIAIQGENPIATKGWPCFAHDNRNTFNYSKRNN